MVALELINLRDKSEFNKLVHLRCKSCHVHDGEVRNLRLLAVPEEGVRGLCDYTTNGETNQHAAAAPAKARKSSIRRTPPEVRSTRRKDLQLRVGHGGERRDGSENGELGEHRAGLLSLN